MLFVVVVVDDACFVFLFLTVMAFNFVGLLLFFLLETESYCVARMARYSLDSPGWP